MVCKDEILWRVAEYTGGHLYWPTGDWTETMLLPGFLCFDVDENSSWCRGTAETLNAVLITNCEYDLHTF